MPLELDAARIPLLLTGVLTLAIGIAISLLDVTKRANRAFGALLSLRGANFVVAGFMTSGMSLSALTALLFMQPYLMLPVIPLALYFVSVFPRRRGPLHFEGSGWLIVLTILVLEIAYFINHGLAFTVASGASGGGIMSAAPGLIYTDLGPFVILMACVNLALSCLGVVYAWEYVKGGKWRSLYLLMAAGFILNGIFDGGLAAASLINDPSLAGLSGIGWAIPIARALSLLPAAVALGMIISTQREEFPSKVHWVLPTLALVALLSGPIPIIMGVSGYGLTWHSLIILSLWRLVMPVTVGYALIRSGMLEHVRLPHLWLRGHHKATARPTASARGTED